MLMREVVIDGGFALRQEGGERAQTMGQTGQTVVELGGREGAHGGSTAAKHRNQIPIAQSIMDPASNTRIHHYKLPVQPVLDLTMLYPVSRICLYLYLPLRCTLDSLYVCHKADFGEEKGF
jgi:hypothetical protein